MEEQIQTYVTTPKLQSLLTWAEQITDNSESDIKPVGKRAIALAYALAQALAQAKAYGKALGNANPLAYAKDLALAYAQALAQAQAKAYVLAKALALIFAYAYANSYTYAYAYAKHLEHLTRYFQELEKLAVYKTIDFNEYLDKLEKLQEQIPDDNQPREIHRDFANKIIQTILEASKLTTEMIDLSLEEIEAFDNYFYANKFMLDCKKAASPDSQDTWDKIEARMLLPKTSWEKLKRFY